MYIFHCQINQFRHLYAEQRLMECASLQMLLSYSCLSYFHHLYFQKQSYLLNLSYLYQIQNLPKHHIDTESMIYQQLSLKGFRILVNPHLQKVSCNHLLSLFVNNIYPVHFEISLNALVLSLVYPVNHQHNDWIQYKTMSYFYVFRVHYNIQISLLQHHYKHVILQPLVF
ncbi:hypothetical protein FGO68_gene15122 [Halteria grandinella]|uniref:Uncharacterized protein n=1 Tax=Halteria grandinella TaxID=5974 RepID=A0A8J8NB20_HALGN|nr:hypothetical protein FGO68_gene15122 [Halteria grandinella]